MRTIENMEILVAIKRYLSRLVFIPIVFLLSACSLPMTLTVLDQETKQPIEDASCIAWWNVKEIDGSYYVAKIVEAKTDTKGKFRVPMVLGRKALRTPNIKIYKHEYVGWDAKSTYEGHQVGDDSMPLRGPREDFGFKSQNIYLERYDGNNLNYSRETHFSYLSAYLPSPGDMGLLGIKYLQYNLDIIDGELPSK
jgi:hypothetical protein